MWFWFRYGEIVKTHILGCPCVMLASSWGCVVCVGDTSPLVQAHIPTKQGTVDREMGTFLSPRFLPFADEKVGSRVSVSWCHSELSPGHWSHCCRLLGVMVWGSCYKHLPWVEEGKPDKIHLLVGLQRLQIETICVVSDLRYIEFRGMSKQH